MSKQIIKESTWHFLILNKKKSTNWRWGTRFASSLCWIQSWRMGVVQMYGSNSPETAIIEFKGRLTNQPAYITSIQLGRWAGFAREHIVLDAPPSWILDTQKGNDYQGLLPIRRDKLFTIYPITCKIVVGNFTGYEFMPLDDPSKIAIISLEAALDIEPLVTYLRQGWRSLCLPSGEETVEDC